MNKQPHYIKNFFNKKAQPFIKKITTLGIYSILILPQEINKIKNEQDNKIQSNKNEINILKQKKINNIITEEFLAIQSTIKNMKSFNDFPLKIHYLNTKNTKFPKTIDIWPKLTKEGRKNEYGNIVKQPDPVIIILDNRKFSITPEIGIISNIIIYQGSIILETSKLGIKIKNETYDSTRLTRLILKLRNHTSEKGNDIDETPRAIVKEI